MIDTSRKEIGSLLKEQRSFFAAHETKEIDFRIRQLKRFKAAIKLYDKRIAAALYKDLRKSYQEAYLTEISIVLQEIGLHIQNLKRWAEQERISTPWYMWPSKTRVVYEPLGVSLIMAPWNYPFQLLMNPLVGAISAGCTAILKPAPYSSHTALVMQEMIAETFDRNYVSVVQGGRQTNQLLWEHRFDVIFFTGSPAVGKIVMKAASDYLTPVILELGGKSPCIVDEKANLLIAARRIAWGKTINAGQTCIAPDYLLVHEDLKDRLIKLIGEEFETMYGQDFQSSNFYPRIINEKAFDRLSGYLNAGHIAYGGQKDQDDLFIQPTLIDQIKPEDPIMQEEIFGPLLPVISFRHVSEAIEFVNEREKPLAFYYFGKSKRAKEVLNHTSSGGACINDTIMHIVNHRAPFGGVGNSGMGKYHGYDSFLAFSNRRSVIHSGTDLDLPFRYVPFKGFNLLKKFL